MTIKKVTPKFMPSCPRDKLYIYCHKEKTMYYLGKAPIRGFPDARLCIFFLIFVSVNREQLAPRENTTGTSQNKKHR